MQRGDTNTSPSNALCGAWCFEQGEAENIENVEREREGAEGREKVQLLATKSILLLERERSCFHSSNSTQLNSIHSKLHVVTSLSLSPHFRSLLTNSFQSDPLCRLFLSLRLHSFCLPQPALVSLSPPPLSTPPVFPNHFHILSPSYFQWFLLYPEIQASLFHTLGIKRAPHSRNSSSRSRVYFNSQSEWVRNTRTQRPHKRTQDTWKRSIE